MRDKDLYAAILGIRDPWQVRDVELDTPGNEVRVVIASRPDVRHLCPRCSKPCAGYDTRRRSWRHLDTCQFKTILVADVPRIECAEHGVHQIDVPWSVPGSGFTVLMEALVIDWLKEANTTAVARLLRLSWDEIDGIMQRAVQRGLARREFGSIERVAIDETSFQKRHEYVTVVSDLLSGNVLYVADDRTKRALDGFFVDIGPVKCAQIQALAVDMCQAYVSSILEHVEGAESKICFDRFHVAKLLNDAVNDVRKQENRELRDAGDHVPPKTKFIWAQNPENMPQDRRAQFELLKETSLKAARAWALKDAARKLWRYVKRGWATRAWKLWIGWAMRSRLEPMKRAARTIRDRLWGIVNAIVLGVTNALAESNNAKIQWIKKQACGFRNRERFRNAIYFHLGGLDLYPSPASATHTTS